MMKLGSALAIFALATVAPSAQAALQLAYQINGGTVTVCNSGTDDGPVVCPTISASGVTITLFQASSNSPGTPANANLFANQLTIQNTTGSTISVDLWASAQDFTSPSTPPGILWSDNESLDGVTGTTTGNAVDCVETNNSLQPGGVGTTTPNYCSGGIQLANTPQTISGSNSASNTVTTTISSLSGPYSISTMITLSLGAGAEMHFQDSQILSQTPEPMSIALLGGVLLLSAKALRRKRA